MRAFIVGFMGGFILGIGVRIVDNLNFDLMNL